MNFLILISLLAIVISGCKTTPNSDTKDIGVDHKLHDEKVVLFSALDENQLGHVFFKTCTPSSEVGRDCEALGESHKLKDQTSYHKKMAVQKYRKTLPGDKQEKILKVLLKDKRIILSYLGGVQGGDLTEEEVLLAFKAFGWPGEGTNSPTPTSGKCHEGYLPVPGNGELNTKSFCVMKYEAKQVDKKAISQAEKTPWVSISRNQARAECSKVDASLMTNAQWQTIARNIESVGKNWSGAKVGSGSLNRGHSDGTKALSSSGSEAVTWDKNKRTHLLSNGELISDLAGNVWEWVNDDNNSKQGSDQYVSQEPWNGAAGKLKWGPKGTYKNKDSGEYGGLGKSYLDDDSGAVLRGGGWNYGTGAGVFHALLYYGASSSDTYVGFRCVRPLR